MIFPSQYCAATGQGRRDEQEDRMLCEAALGTFAVADGIGGHPEGDIAAQMTVDAVRDVVLHHQASPADPRPTPQEIVTQAAVAANRFVYEYGTPGFSRRPGSTLTAIRFPGFAGDSEALPEEVAVVQVGDSRLYRLRRANPDESFQVEQLTSDQAGAYGLTMHIGRDPDAFQPEVASVPCLPGDLLLLSTDGLWCHVDPRADLGREVAYCLRSRGFSEVAQWLVDICERSGGRDNTTVIVVEVGKRGEIIKDGDGQ